MTETGKWTDLFCRAKDSSSGERRYSLKGARSYLFGFDGYQKGDFEPLDCIIALLESGGIKPIIEGTGAPGHPTQTEEWTFKFEGGSFVIYAGNYLGCEPGQGAFVIGTRA